MAKATKKTTAAKSNRPSKFKEDPGAAGYGFKVFRIFTEGSLEDWELTKDFIDSQIRNIDRAGKDRAQ